MWKTFSVEASDCRDVLVRGMSLTAGVGVRMVVLRLESCGRMNSVDKKNELIGGTGQV